MITETKTTITISWGGLGLFLLTSIILTILKICGVCTMNWVWIWSFTWIPAGIIILFFAIIAISLIYPLVKSRIKRENYGNEDRIYKNRRNKFPS